MSGSGPVSRARCAPSKNSFNVVFSILLFQLFASARGQQVAVSETFACAIRSDQQLVCWGSFFSDVAWCGGWGFTAESITAGTAIPAPQPPRGQYVQVSVGAMSVCGVFANQTLLCFGSNLFGQSSPPRGSYLSVACGDLHCCGLFTNHTIVCWGCVARTNPGCTNLQYSGYGNLGQCSAPSGRFASLVVAAFTSCALDFSGQPFCW